jgi:hypothetical protein
MRTGHEWESTRTLYHPTGSKYWIPINTPDHGALSTHKQSHMRTLLCAFLVFVSALASSQTWQWSKHIGGPGLDLATTLKIDSSSNIYLTGSYAGQIQANWEDCYFDEDSLFGSHDAFIAKYNSNGELLWLRDIPSTGAVGIATLALDEANAVFYTLGTFEGNCQLDTITVTATGNVGVVLAKWNLEGHCLWARSIASSGCSLTYMV